MTMNENTDNTVALTQAHRQLLNELGIKNPDALAPRYRSVNDAKELEACGFAGVQRRPGLVVTLYNVGRQSFLHQLHPDEPRIVRGQNLDQEFPRGSKLSLDVPPSCQPDLQDLAVPLFVVNDPFDADALAALGRCAVDLLGMGQSVARNPNGKIKTLGDWQSVALSQRRVYRLLAAPASVQCELRPDEAAKFLADQGADVSLIVIPHGGSSAHPLASYLAGGGSVDALVRDSQPVRRRRSHEQFVDRFIERDGGTYEIHHNRDGDPVETILANFTVRIIAELRVTDGVEEHREFRVRAVIAGQEVESTIKGDAFDRMEWVIPTLGVSAIIAPGVGVKDRLRAAIQQLSAPVPKVVVRNHLGWFEHDGELMFAHAGGVIRLANTGRQIGQHYLPAVTTGVGDDHTTAMTGDPSKSGAAASVTQGIASAPLAPGDLVGPSEFAVPTSGPGLNVLGNNSLEPSRALGPSGPSLGESERELFEVRPPAGLELYDLPIAPTGRRLLRSVRRTLRLLSSPLPEVFMPLFAATFGAVLGGVPANLWIVADSGNLKSAIVSIFARCFGPGMDPESLPANWNSTENALLAIAHAAKDVILPIDDWLLRGTAGEVAAAERKADVVFRSAANRAARGRCRPDGTVRASRAPRGTIISTAESTPDGASLAARCVKLSCRGATILENPRDHNWLNRRQHDAANGIFAETMAAFIHWLIPRVDEMRSVREDHAAEIREKLREHTPALHDRQKENLADLLARFDRFLEFASDIGAIDDSFHARLFEQLSSALISIAETAIAAQEDLNRADRILEIARTALLTRHAHLLPLVGDVPQVRPEACGWVNKRAWVHFKNGKHWSNPFESPFPGLGGAQGRQGSNADDDDGDDEVERRTAWPTGEHIGYVQGESAYLLPGTLLELVVRHSRQSGTSLPVNSRTLGTILRDAKKLEDYEKKRHKCTVRINVPGEARIPVYKISMAELVPYAWTRHPGLEPGYESVYPIEELLEA